MNDWEVEWSRNHFRLLAINGVWGVPRSGLVFRKVSESEFALDNLMPWSEDMGRGFEYGFSVPPTKDKLLEYQRDDFNCIAKRFTAAGIKMTDPKGLLK